MDGVLSTVADPIIKVAKPIDLTMLMRHLHVCLHRGLDLRLVVEVLYGLRVFVGTAGDTRATPGRENCL